MPPKKTAAATKTSAKTKTAKRKAKKEEPDAESSEDEGSEKVEEVEKVVIRRGRGKKIQTEVDEDEVKTAKKEVEAGNKKKRTVKEETEVEPKENKIKKSAKKAKADDKSSENKEAKGSAETKVKKSKKAKEEKVEEVQQNSETDDESSGATKGKKRKAPPKTAKKESGKEGPDNKVPRMNATATKWENIDFSCASTNSEGQTPNFHITSWNVDGLRAWLKKGGLDILQYDLPDIFCIQETKCSIEKLPEEVKNIDGYETLWCSSDKEGYAGVGIVTKIKPLEVTYGIDSEEHDIEGRCITAEYEKFFLVNVYVPNAGRKLITLPKRLDWNELFKAHIKKLDEKKPVIICGDMNVAHTEIDLANPKTNTKNAGFTVEEREGMTDFLEDGYVDTFRKLYPDKEKVYTFWTYMGNARSKNVGWRLDYFIVSERLMEHICDNVVHSDVLGSDHCPVSLHINI